MVTGSLATYSVSDPKVSVILPTYNRMKTLPRAVESVLRQTYQCIELVIVDDASNDGTAAFLETICDPRVRVLRHEKNRGANAARNNGIRAALAPLIAFQDSDDEWLITKLERQMSEFSRVEGPKCGAIYCSKLVYGQGGARQWGKREVMIVPSSKIQKLSGNIYHELLNQGLVGTQTLLVRRSLLDDVGYFDEDLKIGQEWELSLRLAKVTDFAFIEEPLVLTYVSNDSLSLNRINAVLTWERIIERHRPYLVNHPEIYSRAHTEIGRISSTTQPRSTDTLTRIHRGRRAVAKLSSHLVARAAVDIDAPPHPSANVPTSNDLLVKLKPIQGATLINPVEITNHISGICFVCRYTNSLNTTL